MQLPYTEKQTGDTLYRCFAPRILIYLERQVVNRQDAEDLLLEVFLRASRETTLERLSEERQLAWLWKVARNKVIDYHRHYGLISWLPLEQASEMEDENLTPTELVERQEKYTWLYQSLKQLSAAQQELIWLRYGCEWRFTEIAEVLKRPEGTIRKMLARTLRQLRTYYDQMEGGQEQ
jgi:RNA polymerase sigma factor (sigma-70 family)